MVSSEEKKYIDKVIRLLLRPEASKIALAILEKNDATEEWLTKRTDMKLSVVRKILYDMYELGLVDFRRERDEKTSWYIYHINFKFENFNKVVIDRLRYILERKLKLRLKYELSHSFYECPKHKKLFTESEALQLNYICPYEDCGEVMLQRSNQHIIDKLTKYIGIIEKILDLAEEKKNK
jgi:transcription initiation factor TFIIE subunit alpha